MLLAVTIISFILFTNILPNADILVPAYQVHLEKTSVLNVIDSLVQGLKRAYQGTEVLPR